MQRLLSRKKTKPQITFVTVSGLPSPPASRKPYGPEPWITISSRSMAIVDSLTTARHRGVKTPSLVHVSLGLITVALLASTRQSARSSSSVAWASCWTRNSTCDFSGCFCQDAESAGADRQVAGAYCSFTTSQVTLLLPDGKHRVLPIPIVRDHLSRNTMTSSKSGQRQKPKAASQLWTSSTCNYLPWIRCGCLLRRPAVNFPLWGTFIEQRKRKRRRAGNGRRRAETQPPTGRCR